MHCVGVRQLRDVLDVALNGTAAGQLPNLVCVSVCVYMYDFLCTGSVK